MLKRENKRFPKISIIIPSLNKVKYIDETIESILSQKYPNLEVIIKDGGSTDGTVNAIKRYARKHPSVIKWTSKKDGGQHNAINSGLKESKGEILAYISADDIYRKGAFIRVAESYIKNPNKFWFVGFGDVVDSRGNTTAQLTSIYKGILLLLNRFSLLLSVNYIMQPSVFITKRAYRRFGSFTGEGNYVMEYETWLKLGMIEMPVMLPFVLSSFRISPGSISSERYREVLASDIEIVRKYTNNRLILGVHRFNNYMRTLLIKYYNKKYNV